MTTKDIGDIAEAQVIAALLKIGKTVLMPWGDKSRYDAVIDEDGIFKRIQIKNGRLEPDGAVEFNTCSTTRKNGKSSTQGYAGQVEYFGVYCASLNSVYLVPIGVCSRFATRLRTRPTKHGQTVGVHLAEDFKI